MTIDVPPLGAPPSAPRLLIVHRHCCVTLYDELVENPGDSMNGFGSSAVKSPPHSTKWQVASSLQFLSSLLNQETIYLWEGESFTQSHLPQNLDIEAWWEFIHSRNEVTNDRVSIWLGTVSASNSQYLKTLIAKIHQQIYWLQKAKFPHQKTGDQV